MDANRWPVHKPVTRSMTRDPEFIGEDVPMSERTGRKSLDLAPEAETVCQSNEVDTQAISTPSGAATEHQTALLGKVSNQSEEVEPQAAATSSGDAGDRVVREEVRPVEPTALASCYSTKNCCGTRWLAAAAAGSNLNV